jgi:superfamily II DNA or RNA helicase
MSKITVTSYNETHVRVNCDDYGVEMELQEYFTFSVPGAKFTPKFKSGQWDGNIKLLNTRNKLLYTGLISLVHKFARSNGYEIDIARELNPTIKITRAEVSDYMHGLNLTGRGVPIQLRDYQIDAVYKALSNKRLILVSATGSGKSLILYSIIRYCLDKEQSIVLIVPTVSLVNQMVSDFKDYSTANGFDVDKHIHGLYSGKDRIFNKPVTISTWQTLASMHKSDSKNYLALTANTDVLLADEAHTLKAAVVSATIEGFVNTSHRIGTTGTLHDALCNKLVLIGLLGPAHEIISASELIAAGQAVPIDIKVIILKHPSEFCKMLKSMDYKEELQQIISNPARNAFIANLAKSLSGNTLILYRFVATHGQILYDLIKENVGDTRAVYFIHGGVEVEERDRIRLILENDKSAIVVATESLMSTGINIPSLENLIFACPGKSAIRIRQSIGRTLRLKEGKTHATIYDIADDYRASPKARNNITLNHLNDRLAIYVKEDFKYSIRRLELKYDYLG